MTHYQFDNDHYRSQNGTGSMVELPSNMSVLAPIQLEKHYAQIHAGELPPEITSEILHELTHHWCFNSPMGSTLTALYFRIFRGPIAERIEPILEDIVRFETTRSLLRPITEGLALFGEFDVRPGCHDSRSPVLLWLLSLFHKVVVGIDCPPITDVAFEQLLSKMRDNDRPARLKESLLCNPLGTHQGGYLAGYLAVKGLWHKVRHDVPDAELFWCFLRSYFFDDHAFLDAILKPNEMDDAEAEIFTYFQERLALLRSMDLPAALMEYNADLRQRSLTPPPTVTGVLDLEGMPRGLHVDAERATQGITQANALLNEVREFESSKKRVLEFIARVADNTFARRHLLCLGTASGHVTVQEGMAEFVSKSGFIHRATSVPTPRSKVGAGTFEIYYSTTGHFRVEVITIGPFPVSVQLYKSWTVSTIREYEEIALNALFFNREMIFEINRIFEKAFNNWFDIPEVTAYLDELRKHRQDVVNWIYLEHYSTLSNCHDIEQVVHLWKMMFEKGCWEVLGEELELVRGVSILSVGQAARWSEAKIDARLSDEGLEREEVVSKVKAIEDRLGIQLFEEDGLTLRL